MSVLLILDSSWPNLQNTPAQGQSHVTSSLHRHSINTNRSTALLFPVIQKRQNLHSGISIPNKPWPKKKVLIWISLKFFWTVDIISVTSKLDNMTTLLCHGLRLGPWCRPLTLVVQFIPHHYNCLIVTIIRFCTIKSPEPFPCSVSTPHGNRVECPQNSLLRRQQCVIALKLSRGPVVMAVHNFCICCVIIIPLHPPLIFAFFHSQTYLKVLLP